MGTGDSESSSPSTIRPSRICDCASSRWRSTRRTPYEKFATGAETVRDDLAKLCRSLKDDGKTIHVYGASTKGNTILQYADLDHTVIPYAADRNADKWGSRTIRTEIPIISEEESRAMEPDYYLVLPWHFLDEFLEREACFFRAGRPVHRPAPRGSYRRSRRRQDLGIRSGPSALVVQAPNSR